MIGLNVDLSSLGFKKENTALFLGFFMLLAVLYHFQTHTNKDIRHINEILNNHITDLRAGQNKLEVDIKELNSKFDNLQNILLSNKFSAQKED